MWIHWSVTRLVRWRVRDWASCFTACRFPLGKPKKIKMNTNLKYILKRKYILYQFDMFADDETDATCQSSSAKVYDTKDKTGNRSGKNLLRRNRWNKRRCARTNMTSPSSTQGGNNNNPISAENASSINNDASWPSFADEDYIVFCFKEDGAFDVVKDCKSEASNHIECTRRSSWYINRKKVSYIYIYISMYTPRFIIFNTLKIKIKIQKHTYVLFLCFFGVKIE